MALHQGLPELVYTMPCHLTDDIIAKPADRLSARSREQGTSAIPDGDFFNIRDALDKDSGTHAWPAVLSIDS